jgi:hypothetical protein
LFFGLFFLLTAAPGLIVSVLSLIRDPQSNWFTSGISTLCTSLFAVIGLVIIGASVFPWIAELRVGKPEISISTTSVRVGDGFSVDYSQIFKKKADVKGIKVSLLQCERATYSSGSSSTTVTHEEITTEFDSPARIFETGDLLTFRRGIEIPRDGMHTFKTNHNEIAWLLRVKVEIASWPDYREDFEINVQPILAR